MIAHETVLLGGQNNLPLILNAEHAYENSDVFGVMPIE